jgi:WD40 repeat protein
MNTQQPIAAFDQSKHNLLSAAFNQDLGCFAIAYETGFRVYNSDPMELNVKREFTSSNNDFTVNNGTSTETATSSGGGIGIAQMLHRTNYLALVGGGRNPKFPQNKVIIWDDLKRKPALSLEFLSPVLNVLLSRTHIIVILLSNVHVFAFSSPPTRIASYETAENPNGIGVMAGNVLAFPARTDGQIQIVTLDAGNNSSSGGGNTGNSGDNFSVRSGTNVASGKALVTIVRAHRGPIRCLALNANGSVIASASDMGTIIRLHSTHSTALLHEFRRGLDRAIIFSMAFSPSSTRLAVLSDKNTLHVFDTATISSSNRRHVLGKIPFMPRYFSSEWSFASCRVDNYKGILGWSSDDSIIVVWITNCKWEKYVIVEKEDTAVAGQGTTLDATTGLSLSAPENWELVREAWRGFEGLSYD